MKCPNSHCQAMLPDTAKACPVCRLPLPGVLHLGRYAIAGILYRGEHVFQYQATDTEAEEAVELRVLLDPGPQERGVLLGEARAIQNLELSGLQRVRSIHEEGLPTVVLEAPAGKVSLERAPFTEFALVTIGLRAARILWGLHRRGIHHRDLRPEHLRLDKELEVTLCGWGWERMIAARAGTDAVGRGMPRDYLAPEALEQQGAAPADFYSLGMVLMRLATGIDPGHLYQPTSKTYAWRSHARLSDGFADLIDALIHPEARLRLGYGKEVIARLEGLLPPEAPALSDPALPEPSVTLTMPWRSLGQEIDLDRRLAVPLALLVFLFPMLPAGGPGVRRPFKLHLTTLADPERPLPTASPMLALTAPVRPAIPSFGLAPVTEATAGVAPWYVAPAIARDAGTWAPVESGKRPDAWEIRVSRSEHFLAVYRNSLRLMSFPVGLGMNGSTPVGRFPIVNKAAYPDYRDPGGVIVTASDPRNPLGTRWMGLAVPGRHGIGIHGTRFEDSIGFDRSLGCIRMRNPDVERLYEAIPAHAWVEIDP